MESWRAFRLEEEGGPKFKENPKDAVALLGKVAELDPNQQSAVAKKIASDPDVAPVISALEELFKELEKEPIEEERNLEADIGAEIMGAFGGAANKVTDFLDSSAAGRVLKIASGPVLGLALLASFVIAPGESGGALTKLQELIGKLMTSNDPATILAGSAEALVDVVTESLRERKKN